MIIVVQPVVPHYRMDFFGRLAAHFGQRFKVHASPDPSLGVLMNLENRPDWEVPLGPVKTVVKGMDWQVGAVRVPLKRGHVLVLSGAPRSVSNILLMIRARLVGAKVVWWGHYNSPSSTSLRHGLRVLLMRGASSLLFYTDREIALYRESKAGRSDARPIFALNNGLDTAKIQPYRADYRVEARENVAFFIGRLTAKSKLDLAFQALAQMQDKSFKLHVLGTGTEQDALSALSVELGIADRIIWNEPTTDEAEIAKVANRCRFFLYPGNVGLSIVHGLAYGLPIVVHDDPMEHMPEIAALEPDINGRVFKRHDAASLAQTLDALGQDEETLSRLSSGAVSSIEKSFNTADMAERFIHMIQELEPRP